MRQFQKIVNELKAIVENHKAGDLLTPPQLMPSIEIDGHRLAYVSAGMENTDSVNPPVVLLHGFGGFFMDWPRVMAPISRHTRVYALDLPGWGFSEPNLKIKTLEDHAAVVGEFLQRMGLENAIICGISYGAAVAWAAGALGIERIGQVVLLNPMPPNPIKYMHSAMYRAIFFMNSSASAAVISHKLLTKIQYKLICRENLLNDRLLDTFYLDLAYMVTKQPKIPAMLYAFARGARDIDWTAWEKQLGDIQVPVTIMQGREDRIFSMESAKYLQSLIPGSELIEIAECGHAMVFDQHRKVSEFIIKGLPSKQPSFKDTVVALNPTAVNDTTKDAEHESVQEDLRIRKV